MSDTPDPNKSQSEPSSPEPAGSAAGESESNPTPQVKAPVKPVKQPSKPVSLTPASKKEETPAPKPDPSITFDEKEDDDTPGTAMLVVDGLAAVIAITFTVLILRDVMPFL